MGRFLIDLEGNFFTWKHCKTHLALANEFISESIQGRHGRTYVFNDVVNVTFGEEEEWEMMGELHTVVDIFCVKCGSDVGWKFQIERQKITERKFVLERELLHLITWWTVRAAAVAA